MGLQDVSRPGPAHVEGRFGDGPPEQCLMGSTPGSVVSVDRPPDFGESAEVALTSWRPEEQPSRLPGGYQSPRGPCFEDFLQCRQSTTKNEVLVPTRLVFNINCLKFTFADLRLYWILRKFILH